MHQGIEKTQVFRQNFEELVKPKYLKVAQTTSMSYWELVTLHSFSKILSLKPLIKPTENKENADRLEEKLDNYAKFWTPSLRPDLSAYSEEVNLIQINVNIYTTGGTESSDSQGCLR